MNIALLLYSQTNITTLKWIYAMKKENIFTVTTQLEISWEKKKVQIFIYNCKKKKKKIQG